jgi:hypothetical protein
MRGLPPIPEPKVDRYKPPRVVRRPIDPAEAEAAAEAAADFGREDDSGPSDVALLLDWARTHAADCTHEELQRALDDTAHLVRRPRGILAEYRARWARAIVADEMGKGNKKDAAVYFAADRLRTADQLKKPDPPERAIWTAIKPAPAAPPLTNDASIDATRQPAARPLSWRSRDRRAPKTSSRASSGTVLNATIERTRIPKLAFRAR